MAIENLEKFLTFSTLKKIISLFGYTCSQPRKTVLGLSGD
jgi:hypothetical protein